MKAKKFIVEKWINCNEHFSFDVQSNKIKIIHAFQMLCPGCVYKGIPQTALLFEKFDSPDVQVVGLHSVFENHQAMSPENLEVFVKEWRLPFPIGVDLLKENEWMPETMKAYQLQGTPSLVIIDHLGEIQLHHFGHADQEKLEVIIENLIERKNQFKGNNPQK